MAPNILKERPKTSLISPVSLARVFILSTLMGACSGQAEVASPPLPPTAAKPQVHTAPSSSGSASSAPLPVTEPVPVPEPVKPCPSDMVDVGGKFCIDRYEASLVDGQQGRSFSIYYPPDSTDAQQIYDYWKDGYKSEGTDLGKRTPPPRLPKWQTDEKYSVKPQSLPGVLPNAYVSAIIARQACEAVGKRLCAVQEWQTACGGENQTKYPYGDSYEKGVCNYSNPVYGIHLLQGTDVTYRVSDPRLNTIQNTLGKTGERGKCMSKWGDDGIYDMVGNLDEWVSDSGSKHGVAMVGGSYIRHTTKSGCSARLVGHYALYRDYTTGARCCADVQHDQ